MFDVLSYAAMLDEAGGAAYSVCASCSASYAPTAMAGGIGWVAIASVDQ